MTLAELITIGACFFGAFLGSLIGCMVIYISTENNTEYKNTGSGYKVGNKYPPLHRTESQEYEVELRNKPDRF